MGLLSLGTPLSWTDTKKLADHVRKHGIIQFLHVYNERKNRGNDELKWGDEVSRYWFAASCTKRKHDKKGFIAKCSITTTFVILTGVVSHVSQGLSH